MIWRVRDRATFEELRRTRHRGRSGPIWARFVPADSGQNEAGSSQDPTRVAFTISTKVGGAVVRNRLRRHLRAICRDLDTRDRLPAGVWLFGVDPRGASAPYSLLASAVVSSVAKAATP